MVHNVLRMRAVATVHEKVRERDDEKNISLVSSPPSLEFWYHMRPLFFLPSLFRFLCMN